MSLQIQLKKSAVSQKQPFASDLAIGELALNYNANGPFLTCKDSAGNVRKLNNVWVATAAPNNPSAGDLWLDTSAATAVLKVYKDSTSTWVNATTIPVATTSIFGSVQLASAADITNGTAGKVVDAAQLQSKISAELSANPITFQGVNVVNNVTIGGDLTVNGTQTIINTTTLDVEDKNIVIGNVATPSNTTADGGGISLLGATTKTLNWVNATGAWTSSERFSVPVGSAAAPSLTFTGDTNTGIYSPGADQVAISTNGTGRLFISSNGTITTSQSVAVTGGLAAWNAGLNLFSPGGGVGQIAASTDAAGTAGTLIFQTGSERLRITSAGLVGVGTSAPAYGLEVNNQNIAITNRPSTGTDNPVLYLRRNVESGDASLVGTHGTLAFQTDYLVNGTFATSSSILAGSATGDNTNTYFAFSTTNSGGTLGERMRLTSAGLGIGTASPLRTLSVVGSGYTGIINVSDTSGGTAWGMLSLGAHTTAANDVGVWRGDANQLIGGNFLNLGCRNGIVFAVSSADLGSQTERARIDSSGRLLVGTSSTPAGAVALLQVQGYSGGSTGVGLLELKRGAAVPANGDELGRIDFSSSASERGAIITAVRDGGTWTTGSSYPGRLVFSTTADGASSPTERMRINSVGAALMGKTLDDDTTLGTVIRPGVVSVVRDGAPALILDRNTSDGTIVSFRRSATVVGTISVTTTATAYNTSSDYRLKENVVAVTDGITRLQQLKPSRFNFIADPTKTVDGFLAHEAAEVVPECVTGEKDAVNDDGNPVYQGIDQSKLVPLLTAALQEAIAKIESLEARLTAAGI